jgi:hypothetical protein
MDRGDVSLRAIMRAVARTSIKIRATYFFYAQSMESPAP